MMLKRLIILFLFSFNLILNHRALAEEIEAKPFTVSPIAESKRKATIIVPTHFKTVSEAIKKAKAGDIIYIKKGSYEEKEGLKLKSDLELVGDGADVTGINLGPISLDLIAQEGEFKNIAIRGLSLNTKNGHIRVGGVNNLLIQNCIITGNIYGMQINSSRNVQIVNCTIANLDTGLMIVFPPVDITLRNSILSNNKYGIYIETRAGIKPQSYMTSQELDELAKKSQQEQQNFKLNLLYNDVWGSENNYRNCQPGKFDISKDPKFVGDSDYHLQSGSPCIDAGDPDKKYNDPDGTRNDLGALPYGRKK